MDRGSCSIAPNFANTFAAGARVDPDLSDRRIAVAPKCKWAGAVATARPRSQEDESVAQPDTRKLDKTKTPGVYRRHAASCRTRGRCKCPYVVRWKAAGWARKQLFPTYELAREFKAGLDSGTRTRQPLSSQTVADYSAQWLVSYRGRTQRGLEDSTRREYARSFRLHIDPLPIAHARMRDLTARDVRDWFAALERQGVSPTSIRKAKAAISVMLATALEDGAIAANPAAGVRYVPSDIAKRRHPRRKKKQLTVSDVIAILNAMPEEWRAFFTLLAQTGVRIGELLGLTWSNVHLGDDPHILVTEQVYRGERKRLKTDASVARVPLSQSMAAWLTALRRESDARPEDPVFPSDRGTALNYSNVYNRVLRPALREAGIAVQTGTDERGRPEWDYQGVAFHAFRKARGSLLLAHGKTLKQVQGWLRHAQLTTTMTSTSTRSTTASAARTHGHEILPVEPQRAAVDQAA
jgi:integrase